MRKIGDRIEHGEAIHARTVGPETEPRTRVSGC
jgi:hypothetical protein